jgi:hypothetical protein
MNNTEVESVQIMRKCPKFDGCSSPICPLDIDQDYRIWLKGEEKCTLSKAKRERIAKGMRFPRFSGQC